MLVFVLVAAALFAPALVPGKVLSGSDLLLFSSPFPPQPPGAQFENRLQYDAAYVFEPDQLQARAALRSLALPTWTTHIGAGRPLLASQQSAPLFPVNWISDVLPYWESLVWVALLKLVLAASGTYLFCRALGLGRPSAALGGLAFGFGTYLVVWLTHPHVNAYLLLPWLFWSTERLCRHGRLADACALAALLGLAFLGGQPESGLIVTLPTAAWGLWRLAKYRSSRRDTGRRLLLGAGAALVGAALAAVMVIPFLEALGQSYMTSRGGGPALEPRAALSALFPDFWGRPDRASVPLGPSNYVERTIYIGVLPALLAVAGLFARRPSGEQVFLVLLLALALLAGLDTGFLSETARDLPGLSQIEVNRVIVLATFAGAVLAAIGLERLLEGSAPERRRIAVAAAVLAVAPAALMLLTHLDWLDELGSGIKRTLGAGADPTEAALALGATLRWLVIGGVAAACVAAIAWRPRWTRVALPIALGLVAIDLLSVGLGFNPAIDKDRADPPASAAIEALRDTSLPQGRIGGDSALGPNTAARWGLSDVRAHELPVVERYEKLFLAAGGGAGDQGFQRTRLRSDLPTPHLLLDLFSVDAVLLESRAAFVDLPASYEGPDGIVVRNPTAFPRAYVAYDWRPSSSLDESILLVVGQGRRLAREAPVIEGAGPPPQGTPPASTAARIVDESETSVVVEADASRPGRLVLLDTYYPGWHATVDGEDAHISAANAAFRSVELPAGRHRIRFDYEPSSVRAGSALSVGALLVLALGFLLARRRSV